MLDALLRSIVVPNPGGAPAFSGGLVTSRGALQLGSHESPAILNLICLDGWAKFRGGYTNITTLSGPTDGAFEFYDSNLSKHRAVWSNGNLYDCISGVPVLKATAVYTAGSRIGHAAMNGILYWACGQPNPVHMQIWNPVTATIGPAPNSGNTGTVTPPASDNLFLYINSIVACAPTWGSGASGGGGVDVYQPSGVAICNAGDPTTWLGSAFTGVGNPDGGKVVGGAQFGISAEGISPFLCFIVGRNDAGVYAFNGAVNALVENQLNVPVGIKDPDTIQYLPTDNLFGTLVFLGTDGQVWGTNGVAADPVSDNITQTIVQAYNLALANNPAQRFTSGYNEVFRYYWVDINGTQYAYRWKNKTWTVLSGWPTGIYFSGTDGSGAPANFVSGYGGGVSGTNYISQICQDGVSDNGTMPSVYYTTPFLHAGDYGKFKDFQWVNIGVYNSGAYYSVQGQSILHSDGSNLITVPNMFEAPSNSSGGSPFIVGVSQLGGPDVLATQSLGITPGTAVAMQGRLACIIPESEWQLPGEFESLKGNAAQFTISYAGGANYFDLLGYEVMYVDKKFRRGSGSLYNPEDVQVNTFDPYSDPPD